MYVELKTYALFERKLIYLLPLGNLIYDLPFISVTTSEVISNSPHLSRVWPNLNMPLT